MSWSVEPIIEGSDRPLLARSRAMAYAILVYMASFSMFVGYVTSQYPPEFFGYPDLWAAAFFLAGVVALFSIMWKRWPTLTAWAGATLAALALVRGLYIGASVPVGDWARILSIVTQADDGGQNASRAISMFQWTAYAVLLFLSWPALIHDTGVRPPHGER